MLVWQILEDCNIVMENFEEVLSKTEDADKKAMLQRLFEKMKIAVTNLEAAVTSGVKEDVEVNNWFSAIIE